MYKANVVICKNSNCNENHAQLSFQCNKDHKCRTHSKSNFTRSVNEHTFVHKLGPIELAKSMHHSVCNSSHKTKSLPFKSNRPLPCTNCTLLHLQNHSLAPKFTHSVSRSVTLFDDGINIHPRRVKSIGRINECRSSKSCRVYM